MLKLGWFLKCNVLKIRKVKFNAMNGRSFIAQCLDKKETENCYALIEKKVKVLL